MWNIAKMISLKDYGTTVRDKVKAFDFVIWRMPTSESLPNWRSPA